MPVVLFLLIAAGSAFGSPLFDDPALLEIELEGPIERLVADVEDREERDFLLRAAGLELPVRVRVRGKSRTRVCRFPPLRLHFRRPDVEETPFAGQHRLKLVTHCRDTDAAELNLLEELAAYRALEAAGGTGFRTRLVRVRYVDDADDTRRTVTERYGFLIESRDELAERIGGTAIDVEGVRRSEIDEDQAAIVYVFQYMIGNTDWSLVRNDADDECCHNVDLVSVGGAIYPIPYDFDLAGVVDAPYAEPDPSLRLKSVRHRRYRGYCLPEAPLRRAIERLVEREEDIRAAVYALPAERRDLDRIARYLDGFFDQAEKPDRLLARFERHCL